MIADAIDTAVSLGWALAAWIVLTSAVAALAVWTVAVTVWAVCRAVWRLLRAPRKDSRDSRVTPVPQRPARQRTARPTPSWVRPEHDYKEAA